MQLKRESLVVNIMKETRKPRILLDQDDVLADFLGGVVDILNDKYNKNVTREQCKNWNLVECYGSEALEVLKRKDFLPNLKPKNDAIEVLKELCDSNLYDIFIATACYPTSYIPKLEWLERYMPFFPQNRLFPISEKNAIWGDVLLDDGEHNVIAYQTIGESVIYDMPHNKNLTQFKRIYNLREFKNYIDDKFYK